MPRVDADGGMPPGHEFDEKSIRHLDGNQPRLAAAVTKVHRRTGHHLQGHDPLRDAAAEGAAMTLRCSDPAAESALRLLAGQAFSRAAARRSYSATARASSKTHASTTRRGLRRSGRRSARYFFENYIFADDEVGREFVGASLSPPKREPACGSASSTTGWVRFRHQPQGKSGGHSSKPKGEVCCFNPPRLASLSRLGSRAIIAKCSRWTAASGS